MKKLWSGVLIVILSVVVIGICFLLMTKRISDRTFESWRIKLHNWKLTEYAARLREGETRENLRDIRIHIDAILSSLLR